MSKLTEKDCIEELIRICRSIVYKKYDEIGLIEAKNYLAKILQTLNELQDENARLKEAKKQAKMKI